MANKKAASKKVATIMKGCVSCGNCVKKCPKKCIHIDHGVVAVINTTCCIGCGKCVKACPAGVVSMGPREAMA